MTDATIPPGSTDTGQAADTATEEVPLLTAPQDGVPEVVATPPALAATIDAMRSGTGPVSVDAERAHGFRYSQRAYLIQVRRAGSGTHLIDPVAFGQPADLSDLSAAIADAEWVIHAANQDLRCLFEVGLVPQTLFDTELAGRLLGYRRVALGTLIEEKFSVRLLKEHSASDWSSRPLPKEWLTYAALDVELLVALREQLHAELVAAGKWEWAAQEFAALAAGAGDSPPLRPDPWRRTSGIHRVKTRRGLAVVSQLWQAREDIARRLDRSPGRILPDLAISDLAQGSQHDQAALRRVAGFTRRQAKRFEINWVGALDLVAATEESQLPPTHLISDAPPQVRLWASKDPAAAARLATTRGLVSDAAAKLGLPVENLLTPDSLRRVCWQPPDEITEAGVNAALVELGAREWQRQLTVPLIVEGLRASAPCVASA